MTSKSTTPRALGGDITIGGDLTVRRLGFGAMRITGKGIWGPPADRAAAVKLIRHVVESGVKFIDTADSYGPDVSERDHRRSARTLSRGRGHRDEGRLRRTGPDEWPVDARPETLRACSKAACAD